MKKPIFLIYAAFMCVISLSCNYGFHDMLEDAKRRWSAETFPGDGAWLSGTVDYINSELRVVFDESMSPETLNVTGSMASESAWVWTETYSANDTLVITPSVNRTNGSGATIIIEGNSVLGRPGRITRTYNIATSVYYVKAGAAGALTGTREDPMDVIQDAVDASALAGTPGVVLVAEGVFTCSGAPPGGTDYDFIADMAEGVSLYGGYSASDWDVRNPEVYVTSLRDTRIVGNVNGYALGLDDPYRVVNYTAGITQSTILDGFEMWVAPFTTGPSTPSACAVFIDDASPTIQNNVIKSYDLGSGFATQTMGIRQITGGVPLIRNNTIAMGNVTYTTTCSNRGIFISDQSKPVVASNYIFAGYNSTTYGIMIDCEATTSTTYMDIYNNIIDAGTGLTASGITIYSAVAGSNDARVRIVNNTINGGGESGSTMAAAISIQRTGIPGADNDVIITNNNLFTNMTAVSSFGILEGADDSYPNIVSNNNIFNCAGLYFDFGTPSVVISNITDLNSLLPDGVNQAVNNIAENIYSSLDRNNVYRFTGSLSSVVFDTSGLDGVAEGWPFTFDYDGNTRTAGNGWSIGAFEYD